MPLVSMFAKDMLCIHIVSVYVYIYVYISKYYDNDPILNLHATLCVLRSEETVWINISCHCWHLDEFPVQNWWGSYTFKGIYHRPHVPPSTLSSLKGLFQVGWWDRSNPCEPGQRFGDFLGSVYLIYLFIWEIGTSWKEQTGQDSWFMVLQPTPNKDFMLCCHAFLRQGESGKGGTPQIKEKKIYKHHIQQESTKSKEVQISKGHIWKKKKTSFGKLLPSTYPHNETTHTKTTSQHP